MFSVICSDLAWGAQLGGTSSLNQGASATLDQNSNKTFDFKLYARSLQTVAEGASRYSNSLGHATYRWSPPGPHCDKGVRSPNQLATTRMEMAVPSYPGGLTQRTFGTDMSKFLLDMSTKVGGSRSAALVSSAVMGRQSLSLGAGLVQSVVSAAIHIIPPMIPPPAWVNQPLPCAPMVAGHNCFGAVLYPVTLADFFLADVTDSMLDGYVAGFPNTYASKVGKTDDVMYKGCFASYMSMHCSSIFPRCSVPLSRDEPFPVGGRLPTCLHLCIVPLVMCPGFWIGDVIGPCQMISVPPSCTQAFYWNLWQLPPQYVNFDEANPFPEGCPPADMEDDGVDAPEDPTLYDAPVPKETVQSYNMPDGSFAPLAAM